MSVEKNRIRCFYNDELIFDFQDTANDYLIAREINSPFLFWQEKRVTEVTVYLLALHESYRTDTGELEHYGASCCPTAITFRVAPEGAYTLEEYWEPRAGTHYSSDVKNKFSGEAAKLLWEYDGAYSSQLEEENLQKARDYVVQHGTT